MSMYLNLSNFSNIFTILKSINNLIHNNNVINHISVNEYFIKKKNISLENDKEIDKNAVHLKAQFQKLFNTNTYQISYFDSYSRKSKTDNFENKRDFKKAFILYAKNRLLPLRFNKFRRFNRKEIYEKPFDFTKILSYHKQRVSKKITSNNFVSNELDLKIEVYKWLLNKNKEAVIIPEYSIGNRRADYLSLNTKKINSTIVEIKSELDTFNRLEEQLKTYSYIGNNIYLAIDIKQYEKFKTKNIILDNHIGILIFDNSKSKKIYELKRATKNPNMQDYPFIQFLSYIDINNAFTGCKCSSRFSKEQKKQIIERYINKKIYNQFAYDILCNRHIIESDIRKKLFYKNEIIKAVASAKELKINRFDTTGKQSIYLTSYIKDKNILYCENHKTIKK